MNRNLGCLFIVGFVFLAGCVSVPNSREPRFYKISSIKESEIKTIELTSDFAIAVGQIKIPEYLNRPHIVTQKDSGQVQFSQFNRWAQPLDEGITQTVKDNIAHILPRVQVVSYPVDFPSNVVFRLDMELSIFEINLDGDLHFVVSWAIIDVSYPENTIIKRSEFRIPVEGNNYTGAVNAVSAACNSLSAEIAQVIFQMNGTDRS